MAALMEELVEEILLRFPPNDPASLICAALVCKQWCRLISSQCFHCRFREFHRTPPMLGILCNTSAILQAKDDAVDKVGFIPTASFPRADCIHINWRAVDAHHGRVLLDRMSWDEDGDDLMDLVFAIWDPVTDEARELPQLPWCPYLCWNASVLCATTTCDHLDCSRGPFLVIPSVLVRDELCSMFMKFDRILKYNVRTREISVIDLPSSISYFPHVLTTTEDGRLGFATVHYSRLYLWSREDGPGDDVGWAQSRVIKLESLLPVDAFVTRQPIAIGFAAGVGFVFVSTNVGVFSIDLRSQWARKVLMRSQYSDRATIVPYMSFYTPGTALPNREFNSEILLASCYYGLSSKLSRLIYDVLISNSCSVSMTGSIKSRLR
ncbi:hypothetical protein EJB05_14107, partial [Eragrostis curvula]